MIRQSDAHLLKPSHNGEPLLVSLPNGSTIGSIASGTLAIDDDVSIPAHVFRDTSLDRSLVSLADLCAEGLQVLLTSTGITVTDPTSGRVVVKHDKSPGDKLWSFPLSDSAALGTHTTPRAYNVIRHSLDADYVLFSHATFGSPTLKTFQRALGRGYLGNWPRLTAAMLSTNPPHTVATALGHLQRTRQGQRSTRKTTPSMLPTQPAPPPPNVSDDGVLVKLMALPTSTDVISTDLPGRLPVTSRHGGNYVMVSVYRQYIHVEPMPSRHAAAYVKALSATHEFFRRRGHKPTLQRLDNETSKLLRDWIASQPGLRIQYVPPDNHRANQAERAINTFKCHFVATLATADPAMPLNLWEDLLPQMEITLNHLRGWGPDPAVSAYHGLHGHPFDFGAHPIAPCGTKVLVFEPKTARTGAWAVHGASGFYLGPALDHYRCWRTYVPATNGYRITDTLEWFPAPLKMPGSSPSELLLSAIDDVASALRVVAKAHPHKPIPHLASTATAALREVAALYDTRQQTSSPSANGTQPPSIQPDVRPISTLAPPPGLQHPSATTSVANQRVSTSATLAPVAVNVPPTPDATSHQRVGSDATTPHSAHPVQSAAPSAEVAPLVAPEPSPTTNTPSPDAHPLPRAPDTGRTTRQSSRGFILPRRSPPSFLAHMTSSPTSALNLDDTGKPLTFRSAMNGPAAKQWLAAEETEFRKLLTIGCIRPIHDADQPPDRARDTTYYNRRVREKSLPDGSIQRRVRGTAGGDRIHYPGDVQRTLQSWR